MYRVHILLTVAASAQDLFLPQQLTDTTSANDLKRAKSITHSGLVAANNTAEQAQKINANLKKLGHKLQECAEHSLEELNDKVRSMWPYFSEELQEIYKGKDLRQRAHQKLEDFEARWKKEDSVTDASARSALRDAKCAEVLMLWVHHVHESGKLSLGNIVLPTLPEFQMDHVRSQPAVVANRVATSYTCITGHGMKSDHTSDHKFPHWPEEVHYQGKGHGAYPFWTPGAGAHAGSPGAIDVYWSEKQLAERLYHASCSMTNVGYSKDTDCYHLFVGGQPSPAAYLYTASKDFCCISGPTSSHGIRSPRTNTTFPPGGSEKLAAPASDWMDDMTLSGTESFSGDFYTGTVKHYLIQLADSEAVPWFWYMTTEDGRPVQQGEGGKSATVSSGLGAHIWHDYNTDTFNATTIDPSIFEVPSVCKSTTTTCQFP